MSLPKLHLMLVDDHAIVRRGMAHLINAEPDMQVVAEAPDADGAIHAIKEGLPLDVIVVDMVLKEVSGTELIRRISKIRPALPILVVSMHNEALYAESAIQAGASGYVMKNASPERLIQAIRHIAKDEIYLSPEMNALMSRRLHCDKSEVDPISRLTKVDVPSKRKIFGGRVVPVELEGQDILHMGSAVRHIALGRGGIVTPLVVPDPRFMAIHKLWLSKREDRSSLKRRKDERQANILWDACRNDLMLGHPIDSDFLQSIPEAWRATAIELDPMIAVTFMEPPRG